MNRKTYEWECLIRSPKYLQDLERLGQDYPRLLDPELWPKDDEGRPVADFGTDAEREALRAFYTRYPAITNDEVFMVLQSHPLLFDPAWKVCVDHAALEYASEHGATPTGLVTRAGVEPHSGPASGSSEEVYTRTRRAFEALSEEARADHRRYYAPGLFRENRILLAIRPDTNFEQVKHLWPAIERAKSACYGPLVRKNAPRPNIYDDRIRAYDLIHGLDQTVTEAARILGKHPRALLRRFHEALRDIRGVKGKLTHEGHAEHVAACPRCREAETQGSSDLYCRWMQRRLGPRTGKIKGSTSLAEEEDTRGERWRGGQDL